MTRLGHPSFLLCYGSLLPEIFGTDGQLLATVATTCSKDATSVGSGHSFTETVLVASFAL